MYIIENSSKTGKQLRDKLIQGKKYTEDVIDKTIEFLKKYDYINDEKYANRFPERFMNNYSKKILIQKLLQKCVKKNIIVNIHYSIKKNDQFKIDDIKIKVMNNKYLIDDDCINNSSIVFKVYIEDKTMMVLGDLAYEGGISFLKDYKN